MKYSVYGQDRLEKWFFDVEKIWVYFKPSSKFQMKLNFKMFNLKNRKKEDSIEAWIWFWNTRRKKNKFRNFSKVISVGICHQIKLPSSRIRCDQMRWLNSKRKLESLHTWSYQMMYVPRAILRNILLLCWWQSEKEKCQIIMKSSWTVNIQQRSYL